MDSHTIENFGNKGISAIGAVLAGQNRGPYTRNWVYQLVRQCVKTRTIGVGVRDGCGEGL